MRSISALGVLAVSIAIAGCVAPQIDRPVEKSVAASTTPATLPVQGGLLEANRFLGCVDGANAADTVAVSPSNYLGWCENSFDFRVQKGARAIVVELAWNGPAALDLFTGVPGPEHCEPMDPIGLMNWCVGPTDNDGTSPARLLITGKEAAYDGVWSFSAYARQSAATVQFRAAVSVFYGENPSEDYTALAQPRTES